MRTTLAKTALLAVSLAAALSTACVCTNNGDAGRWIDSSDPGTRASDLVHSGGGCVTATTQGKMCIDIINPNVAIENCLADYSVQQTSFSGDWFLWALIQCTDGDSAATLTITVN